LKYTLQLQELIHRKIYQFLRGIGWWRDCAFRKDLLVTHSTLHTDWYCSCSSFSTAGCGGVYPYIRQVQPGASSLPADREGTEFLQNAGATIDRTKFV